MNFVIYDPNTGALLSGGWSAPDVIEHLIDSGMNLIVVDRDVRDGAWRVNLQTKELEPIPAE